MREQEVRLCGEHRHVRAELRDLLSEKQLVACVGGKNADRCNFFAADRREKVGNDQLHRCGGRARREGWYLIGRRDRIVERERKEP